MTGHLLAAYIIGSVARSEADFKSDLDILAVVADGKGKVPEQLVLRHVPNNLRCFEPSISWYGEKRLREMFHDGELFAWHVYQESRPIFEYASIIPSLGRPKSYNNALDDIASFEKILAGIPDQLQSAPHNVVYELGLIYVCLRNICMSASADLCDAPDFSRYSPFKLKRVPPTPIRLDEYETAMACRMSGQRGLEPPVGLDREQVADIYGRVAPWIADIRRELEIERGRR